MSRRDPRKKKLEPWCTLKQNAELLPGRDVNLKKNPLQTEILTQLQQQQHGIAGRELIEKIFSTTQGWQENPTIEDIRVATQQLLVARAIRAIGYQLFIDTFGILYLADPKSYEELMTLLADRLPSQLK